jgi:hypothetical protein
MPIEAKTVEDQLGTTERWLLWRGDSWARLVANWLPISYRRVQKSGISTNEIRRKCLVLSASYEIPSKLQNLYAPVRSPARATLSKPCESWPSHRRLKVNPNPIPNNNSSPDPTTLCRSLALLATLTTPLK